MTQCARATGSGGSVENKTAQPLRHAAADAAKQKQTGNTGKRETANQNSGAKKSICVHLLVFQRQMQSRRASV